MRVIIATICPKALEIPPCVILASKLSLIGRAKQAPHWAVQSRFRMIYVGMYVSMSTIAYGKPIQNKTLGRARDPRANGGWLNKLTE